MTHLYLNDHMRLKSYSAAVKGARSVVRIDIEVSEPGALGWLLEDLHKIDRDQVVREKKAARGPVPQLPNVRDGGDNDRT